MQKDKELMGTPSYQSQEWRRAGKRRPRNDSSGSSRSSAQASEAPADLQRSSSNIQIPTSNSFHSLNLVAKGCDSESAGGGTAQIMRIWQIRMQGRFLQF